MPRRGEGDEGCIMGRSALGVFNRPDFLQGAVEGTQWIDRAQSLSGRLCYMYPACPLTFSGLTYHAEA